MAEDSIIEQNILNREILFKIILTAIIISLGTNLIANSLYNLNEIINIVFLIIGLLIVIISSFILIFNIFNKSNQSLRFEGFFLYDSKTNKIIDVINYPLSQNFLYNLDAAFSEDRDIKAIWRKASLKKTFALPFEKIDDDKISARKIIIELFEYIILVELSDTLDYSFSEEGFDAKNLEKYERSDIPDILLHNRFLYLFSKPMDEREAFIEYAHIDDDDNGELVMSTGGEGELYSKFDLILPKKSKLKRTGKNEITIESDKIKLKFGIVFDGSTAVLPSDFEELYLGLKDFLRYDSYKITLELNVKFKIMSLLTISGWKYYKWIDEYIKTLHNEISMDYFLKSINWDHIQALLHVMDLKDELSKKK